MFGRHAVTEILPGGAFTFRYRTEPAPAGSGSMTSALMAIAFECRSACARAITCWFSGAYGFHFAPWRTVDGGATGTWVGGGVTGNVDALPPPLSTGFPLRGDGQSDPPLPGAAALAPHFVAAHKSKRPSSGSTHHAPFVFAPFVFTTGFGSLGASCFASSPEMSGPSGPDRSDSPPSLDAAAT